MSQHLLWPSVALVLRFAIGFVLFAAAITKLRSLERFAETVAEFEVVPRGSTRIVARSTVAVEGISGALLLFGLLMREAASVSTAVFVAFATAVLVNVLRGRRIACGCFGGRESTVSWSLVGRDLVLAVAGVVVTAADPRTFSIDALRSGVHPLPTTDGPAALVIAGSLLLTYQLIVDTLATRSSAAIGE